MTRAAGLIFASGDAAELARNVERLLVEADLRERLIDLTAGSAPGVSQSKHSAWRRGHPLRSARTRPTGPCASRLSAAHRVASTSGHGPARLPRRLAPPAHGKGRVIALRSAATTHLKEAYFDRIVERQVNFNRRLAGAIQELDQELRRLEQATGVPKRDGQSITKIGLYDRWLTYDGRRRTLRPHHRRTPRQDARRHGPQPHARARRRHCRTASPRPVRHRLLRRPPRPPAELGPRRRAI